ncbi:hypothetical protein V8V74_07415 [Niallia taxi]
MIKELAAIRGVSCFYMLIWLKEIGLIALGGKKECRMLIWPR